MKGKQLALLLILLAVFGGVGLFFYKHSADSWKQSATTVNTKIVSFSLNDVSHVTIKTNAAELNLVKKDEIWKVKERADYPANFEMISTLIRKIWELPAVQDVQVGPSQFGRLQLLPPDQGANSGTLLDLKDGKDKRLAALLLGKKYMRESPDLRFGEGGIPVGRYVKAEGGAGGVVLISDTLNEVEPEPKQWLDHDFIKIENPKSIALAGATPEMSWKVTRNSPNESWEFSDAKGEKVDSAKISGVANSLTASTFSDVLAPDAKPAETGLDHPATATIETFDGFVYVLRIGKPMGENYPVLLSVTAQLPKERAPGKDEKPEDKTRLDQEFQTKQKQLTDKLASEKKLEDRPYLISKTTVDGFLKDRSALLPDKPASPSPAATSSPTPAPTKAARRGKPE